MKCLNVDFIKPSGVDLYNNKTAQSNLARGPRRGAVAHVRRKVPIAYNGVPQMRPQKYPLMLTDCHTPIHASSFDPSDL